MKSNGFSFIEVIMLLAIAGLLASIVFVSLSAVPEKPAAPSEQNT